MRSKKQKVLHSAKIRLIRTAAPGSDLTFSQSAKIRLIELKLTVTDLAKKVGHPRNSVSLVINETRRIPSVEKAVRKELNLQEAA